MSSSLAWEGKNQVIAAGYVSYKEFRQPEPWQGKTKDWRKKKSEFLTYTSYIT